MVRGSCLCGEVVFELDEAEGPFELCHCSRCRRASGSGFAASLSLPARSYRMVQGSAGVTSYSLPVVDAPPAYTVFRCGTCGSPVPDPNPSGDRVEIPAGALEDEDFGRSLDRHIYVEHGAGWIHRLDSLARYTGDQIRALRALRRDNVPISTDRLLLRAWTERDLEPFAAMNADPAVMEFFPAPLSRAQSDAFALKSQAQLERCGWGLWAVEVPGEHAFIGFVGLAIVRFEASFTPCVEIGWRLAKHAWGRGYATEGAHAVLGVAFDELELGGVVSLTTTKNVRSRRVMEKLGMSHDPAENFEHPWLGQDDPLRPHVVYRATRA